MQNVDVLEVANRAFRRVYGKAYLDLVNKAPYVLGYFYDYLDRPAKAGKKRHKVQIASTANSAITKMRPSNCRENVLAISGRIQFRKGVPRHAWSVVSRTSETRH